MSRLNFSPINEAFLLGSEQIKNTQEEIAKLKALITATGPTSSKPLSAERIGKPDEVQAVFKKPEPEPKPQASPSQPEDLELTFFKLMKNPKFEDIVKNYVAVKYPEYELSETKYVPNISKFGNSSCGTNDTINGLIIFLIISLIIYLIIPGQF
jgi:hypothetical protein